MLDRARDGFFKDSPIVLVVDEAHQFLGRISYLEDFGVSLDAVETVAKEGRKYGLHLVIATQRPRDLTRAVLSQMGCVIAHRMTEREDLDVLGAMAAQREQGSTVYVSSLPPGECVLFGAALPFPVLARIESPLNPPQSSGSRFSEIWVRLTLSLWFLRPPTSPTAS